MLFNSLEFILFFSLVTVIYFLLPHRYRWFHLLISSCVFYMFFIPVYIFILFFTIIIDYYAGILIEGTLEKTRKKRWLVMSLIANVGILCVFKYCNFFIENVNTLFGYDVAAGQGIPYLSIILPIGLSFHTFQAMSYTIEVYRGNQKAERHLGIYALYVMFYPQLVAGPIERPQNILHQFYEKHEFEYTRVVSGLRLMLWGMFKKVVIADNLSNVVNVIYSNPDEQNGLTYLIAALFFSFQIYCDFSGYSDIAVGSARVMGFDLMKNFNVPYISSSIKEFWARWHISLSSWFRDYLYIPLGGSRVSKFKRYRNLMIVFLLSGLWHGANWTFIAWGALHGAFNSIEMAVAKKLSGKYVNRCIKLLKVIFIFSFVSFAWIFFRSASIQQALLIIKTIFTGTVPAVFNYLAGKPVFIGLGEYTIQTVLLLFLTLCLFYFTDWLKEKEQIKVYFMNHSVFRTACYFMLFYGILFYGFFGNTQFIYFQF